MPNLSVTVNGNPVSCSPNLGNGSGNVQNVALLQNKTSVDAWQSRTVSSADAYATMADIPTGSLQPSYNNSSLDLRITSSADGVSVGGYIALFDENNAFVRSIPFSARVSGIKVASTPSNVFELSSGDPAVDFSQIWLGTASKHFVAITAISPAAATIGIYTRPYR